MIEIIALAATAVLTVSLAAFAWVSKKRIDELQAVTDVLFEELLSLKRRLASRAILRKADGE